MKIRFYLAAFFSISICLEQANASKSSIEFTITTDTKLDYPHTLTARRGQVVKATQAVSQEKGKSVKVTLPHEGEFDDSWSFELASPDGTGKRTCFMPKDINGAVILGFIVKYAPYTLLNGASYDVRCDGAIVE